MRLLLVFVLLAGAQAALLPPGPNAEESSLGARFPGAVGTVLFAGFRPVVLEALYLGFEQAIAEGRSLEAVADARLLARIDAENPRALLYLAAVLSYELANSERTPAGKLSRIMDALEVLGAGEERVPLDPRLPRGRAQILHDRVALDAALAPRYRRRVGREAAEEAREAYLRALRLAPGMRGLRESWLRLTLDQARVLLGADDLAGAHALLRAGEMKAREWDKQVVPLPRIQLQAWLAVLEALGAEPRRLVTAVRALENSLALVAEPVEGGSGHEELGIWVLLLPRLLARAEVAAREADPSAALSLMRALHSIQALTRKRLAQGEPDGRIAPPRGDYEARWKAVLEGLSGRDAALAGPARELRDPWNK